jgi:hypothetical protein
MSSLNTIKEEHFLENRLLLHISTLEASTACYGAFYFITSWVSRYIIWCLVNNSDHLSFLVVRVPGYRCGGPGFDSRHYRKSNGSGTGPLSLVSATEEQLESKSSGFRLESPEYSRRDSSRWPRGTLYSQKVGTNFTDLQWSLGQYSSLADWDHRVFLFRWILLGLCYDVRLMFLVHGTDDTMRESIYICWYETKILLLQTLLW